MSHFPSKGLKKFSIQAKDVKKIKIGQVLKEPSTVSIFPQNIKIVVWRSAGSVLPYRDKVVFFFFFFFLTKNLH